MRAGAPPATRLALASMLALLVAGIAGAAGDRAAAEEEPATEPPDTIYTMLGRGYAVVLGYPADEVPGGDDGDDGDEEPADPPPPQTCPEDQRGVPEDLQARLDRLGETEDAEPAEPADNEVPTPRGQPIKFDIGLADTSLRSDPGAHAIAAFFYVDLGGSQDPWTSAEADGYASGHAREEERCGRPYAGQPGDASQVHVITKATEGPYAYAFNQTQRQQLPGGISVRESVTVSEMDGRSSPVRAKVISLVSGITIGDVHADEVVTVLEFTTDGTDEGSTVTASTDVVGLEVAGVPLDVAAGAPPVAAGGLLVGVATPELRRLPDGSLEMTAGGLYVAGELPNPLGLQAKQAVFVGGAWLDTSVTSFPSFDLPDDAFDDVAAGAPPAPVEPPTDTEVSPGFTSPPGSVETAPTAGPGRADPPPEPAVATPAEEPAAEAAVLAAAPRLGVYRAPPHATGPVLIALGTLAALWFGTFVWARHRYPEIRAALGTPLFRWLDAGYRAFLRG